MKNSNDFFLSHDDEINRLEKRFATYASNVDKPAIISWLKGFKNEHKYLGLKLLQNIKYYAPINIFEGFRQCHNKLKLIHDGDLSNIYFASFGEAGKSGEALLPTYRQANKMKSKKYSDRFVYMSDIMKLSGEEIKVVFVDDFIGSGTQVIDYWEDILIEIIPENVEIILSVLVSFQSAIEEVEDKTNWEVLPNETLEEKDRVFSPENVIFSEEEKKILMNYCQQANPQEPFGYKNTQALVVFHYRIPNNTISLLRCTSNRFKNLFSRYP